MFFHEAKTSNLYGTTFFGGALRFGTVFVVSRSGKRGVMRGE